MGAGLSAGEEAQSDDGASKVQESEDGGGVPVITDRELAKGDDPCVCSPSRQRESHPLPLTEPAMRLSV